MSSIWDLTVVLLQYSRLGIRRAKVMLFHCQDDVIRKKHFPRSWLFVRRIRRSPWIPLTKASEEELLLFSLICTWTWTNGWVNNRDAGDLRRRLAHYNVTVMVCVKEHIHYEGILHNSGSYNNISCAQFNGFANRIPLGFYFALFHLDHT